MFENIKVIKRDGKKVEFDGTKIAIAIKKGFDSITSDGENPKYTEKDINKVYNLVINEILRQNVEKIKIEEIQDLIEKELKEQGYNDVYISFSEYRERRAQSRQIFFEEKKQHKFLKSIEELSLKTSPDGRNINSPFDVMVDYGSTISKEFAKAYMVKKKIAQAQETGEIHIHDLNFMPIGTTTSSQINLRRIFESGFDTQNIHIREPQDIMSYTALAVLVITLNQKEQHGCQSIPAFDYYMAPGVVKTFKKQFKQTIDDILAYTDFDKFAAVNGIEREIEKIETVDFDVTIFDKYCRESTQLKRVFRIAYNSAMNKTERLVSQAMEGFIHDVNVIDSNGKKEKIYPTINLGTDTSREGRMVIDKILDAIDIGVENKKNILSPVIVFKIKEGINYNKEDPNYDLYQKALKIAVNRNYPNFSFLDAPYNIKYYAKNNPDKEVAYNATNSRTIENIMDVDKQIVSGRCNLSYTTINLPRIAIKNSPLLNKENNKNYEGFYNELEEKLNLVKDQLLDRLEIQISKKASDFPFLIGQGILQDGEKLKPDDKVKKIIKQGSLSIGFIGLEECVYALLGKKRQDDKEAVKLGNQIISFMRNKVDEFSNKYNLNFTLMGIDDEKLASEFMTMDKAIYGEIKKITDQKSYTNSFYIPEESNVSINKKIEIEAPYHEMTNGGHIIKISLGNKDVSKLEEVMRQMKEKGIGYARLV